MKDETIVKIVAICGLVIICVAALSKGIDSAVTGSIGAIIGGIAGYEIGRLKSKD